MGLNMRKLTEIARRYADGEIDYHEANLLHRLNEIESYGGERAWRKAMRGIASRLARSAGRLERELQARGEQAVRDWEGE